MNKPVLIGKELPNIPWEDRPKDCHDVVWRSEKNPIILRDAIPSSNSIFNSAVVPYRDGFAGIFRVDDKSRRMVLHAGFSKDGINWTLNPEKISFICDDAEINKFVCGFDPRICYIDDRFYYTWANGYHGGTIGVGYTFDFEKFYQTENAFLPHNRNGVLFPRKINGKYAMLSRPSDNGHTAFGDIFYSESPDMIHWGKHRYVMGPQQFWDATKVGPGPVPIETTEGWLLFYHGVLTSCNGYVYSMGAVILDLEQPWKVLYRSRYYLLSPQRYYECVGDVPNVVFPCAALVDPPTGRIAIYYGGADTVVCMAYANADELIDYIKRNSSMEKAF